MKKRRFKRKKLILAGLVIAAVSLIIGLLETSGKINLIGKQQPLGDDAHTTSSVPSAQADFTGGNDRQPASSDRNEGIVTDNDGQVSNTPPASQWTKSPDGQITVYSPAQNSILKKGDSLSGESRLQVVSFRLIDDVSGVIAQGSLSVVGGKFSGTFDFSTTATNGRLDVFYMSDDGVEKSNLEVAVRFK